VTAQAAEMAIGFQETQVFQVKALVCWPAKITVQRQVGKMHINAELIGINVLPRISKNV